MANIIDYKKIMHSASLSAIRSILLDVSKNGLPGEHHFYVTFDMSTKGVNTSLSLKEKYPSEMTIVIQNWYDNLTVDDRAFSITLNFGNVLENMRIPFSAITSFVDPSVEFGLSFDVNLNSENLTNSENKIEFVASREDPKPEENATPKDKKSGDVVSLESFRKS